MSKRVLASICGAAAALLLTTCVLAAAQADSKLRHAKPTSQDVHAVGLDGAIVLGSPAAKVTLVVASEYDCLYCNKARATVDSLAMMYGADLRVAYLPFIVHPETATLPALAACAAHKQGKFAAMHKILWEDGFEDGRKFSAEDIERHATKAGLKLAKFRADITKCRASVAASQVALSKFGVTGTPAFFINGRFLGGAQPLAAFTKLIDEELAKADKLISRRLPARAYYAKVVMKDGLASTPIDTSAAAARKPGSAVRRSLDRSLVYPVQLGSAPSIGPADAPITIVKAYEYACPFCEKSRDTMDAIAKRYGKSVRFVYQQYIVHPMTATLPALAACAANRQGKFVQMDAILWEQGFHGGRKFEDKDIKRYAKLAGLNLPKFEADVTLCRDEVKAQQSDLAGMGVTGTPAFFINGRFIGGAQPLDAFVEVIEEELVKAQAAIAAGTKPADYYEKFVAQQPFVAP